MTAETLETANGITKSIGDYARLRGNLMDTNNRVLITCGNVTIHLSETEAVFLTCHIEERTTQLEQEFEEL